MQTFEQTERKLAMISLPMKDITREEIMEVWNRAKIQLEKKGYIVVSTIFPQSYADMEDPLWLLSLTINKMSDCEAVYFCDGWKHARGCRIEHMLAEEYGLNIIYQEKEEPLTSDEKAFLDGIRYAHDKLNQYSSEELGTILSRMEGLTETTEERLRAGELYYLGDRCE